MRANEKSFSRTRTQRSKMGVKDIKAKFSGRLTWLHYYGRTWDVIEGLIKSFSV